VFKRLKLLRRLQEIDLKSPEEAMALLERVKTNTSSIQDRERLAHLIRVTAEVTDHIRAESDEQAPSVSKRSLPKAKTKRQRQLTKVARRRQRAS
jgi:hypothetical protein